MAEKTYGFAWQIVSLVLLTIIGHGFVWEYKRLNIENEKLSIERIKNDIEKEKLNIERSRYENERDKKTIEESKQKVSESLLVIERDRNKAEAEKHKIEKVKDSVSLREKKGNVLYNIIILTEEYLLIQREKAVNIDNTGRIIDDDKDVSLYNKMGRLQARLNNYKDDYKNIEISLADLENRKTEKVDINFFPPKGPTTLRIE